MLRCAAGVSHPGVGRPATIAPRQCGYASNSEHKIGRFRECYTSGAGDA